jgi:hypothetical protein
MNSISMAGQYQAVVFKRAGDTADFTTSTEEKLPGGHTQEGAWQALFAELRGPRGADLIGGEIRAIAETVRKRDAEIECGTLQAL